MKKGKQNALALISPSTTLTIFLVKYRPLVDFPDIANKGHMLQGFTSASHPYLSISTREHLLTLEDPLEEGTAKHSSILAWRMPWTEEPGRPQSIASQRVGHDLKRLSIAQHFYYTLLLSIVTFWRVLKVLYIEMPKLQTSTE